MCSEKSYVWQRKALETSNGSLLEITPRKPQRLSESLRRTPAASTPRQLERTPGREAADRFIPSRSGTDFETSRFLLLKGDLIGLESAAGMSPSKLQFQRQMAECLYGGAEAVDKAKVMAFRSRTPKAAFASPAASQEKKPLALCSRHIPQAPDRILDAPDIVNDYYLNLLDWSSGNLLAVALGSHVYLWNASSGEIQQLCQLEAPEDYVCSVRWIKEGNLLAVGDALGNVALWDVEQTKKLRTMTGHVDRVGSLSWNEHVISSGSRSSSIHHSDVRVADHLVGRLSGHDQEVCGLAWSPDGKLLASGGNDNLLNIWSSSRGHNPASTEPLFSLRQHQAAVKALSWCSWQSNILASGGGTADRCIKIWNASSGVMLNSVDTKSQVCSLLWASEYKELVSAHGYSNNEVTIWKYPTLTKTAELLGHVERVLHLAISPDGSTIVSAGADETLRLWKCFKSNLGKKVTRTKGQVAQGGKLMRSIR